MKRAFDTKLLTEFLKQAGEKLKGRWLLVGGTLLPALGVNLRSTVDIDFIGLGKAEAEQQLELMELAESLGLPVDTVNQAAAYFLKKVGHSPEDLIELYRGTSATIYRPTVELYWKLKVGRLSESDAEDCLEYFKFCKRAGDRIDIDRLKSALSLLARGVTGDKGARFKTLLTALD